MTAVPKPMKKHLLSLVPFDLRELIYFGNSVLENAKRVGLGFDDKFQKSSPVNQL